MYLLRDWDTGVRSSRLDSSGRPTETPIGRSREVLLPSRNVPPTHSRRTTETLKQYLKDITGRKIQNHRPFTTFLPSREPPLFSVNSNTTDVMCNSKSLHSMLKGFLLRRSGRTRKTESLTTENRTKTSLDDTRDI